jgi:hypothetical protein
MTQTKEIQTKIKILLNSKFRGEGVFVKEEWNVAKDSHDDLDYNVHYSPRVDIAMGPFMVNIRTDSEIIKLTRAFTKNKVLMEKIKENGKCFDNFDYGNNPRCLIAIEIESSGSTKHLIGDIINASIIGKLGLIVPTNDKNFERFDRIMKYLKFAQNVGKMNNLEFRNIVLIKSEQLISILENFNSNNP